jgi:hypothetical protein
MGAQIEAAPVIGRSKSRFHGQVGSYGDTVEREDAKRGAS